LLRPTEPGNACGTFETLTSWRFLPLIIRQNRKNHSTDIGRKGLGECATQKDANQVAFVFGAAFMIINQIRAISDESGSLRQTFFDLRARACEQCFGCERSAWEWADATHRNASRPKRSAAIRSFQPKSQAQRGALMNLKLHVGGAVIRFRAGQDDSREDFARCQMIRIRSNDELLDGDVARPC